MNLTPPAFDWGDDAAVVGWHEFHPDRSRNFECNRWVQWIGSEAVEEVAALAARARNNAGWIDGFLKLAATARQEERTLAAAYYDRAAEFFMEPADSRRTGARDRFLTDLRGLYGVSPVSIPYTDCSVSGELPAYDLSPQSSPRDTLLVCGGFDSYIEEFLPLMTGFVRAGYRVIAFDGPGQGGALEDHGLPMTPAWERPVTAVLDHFGVQHGVTALGVSLGGGLVVRAAAFDPRLERVIAFDILDDELDVIAALVGPMAGPGIRALLSLRARGLLNVLARHQAGAKPITEWGLRQGMHITRSETPYEFLKAARATNTRGVSRRLRGDVLLLAGANDHFVPLRQLHRQARHLTNARSVTTRTFTAREEAGSHCQVGNMGLAIRTCLAWAEILRALRVPPSAVQGAMSEAAPPEYQAAGPT